MSARTGVSDQTLARVGWNTGDDLSFVWTDPEARPGRVTVVHGASAEVLWFPAGSEEAVTKFDLNRDLNLRPVAGDWVAVRGGDIVSVGPRRTCLSRPDPNEKDTQVLAANIDVVLVVLPIDRGLNLKALERLSVMVWDSGAEPVAVLTKADAAPDAERSVEQAHSVAPGVRVLVTSAMDGTGLDDLRARMGPGTTSTMLGASGVGKTSLLNALEGRRETVREVRRDGEGRHTTTTRRLFTLNSGGVLLDLPGIRSLDLLPSEEALGGTFTDITAMAENCRFRDCAHDGDAGCAVEDAVATGVIPERRLRSWRKIKGEMAYQERRNDPAAMAEQRNQWKKVTKASRARKGRRGHE